ncbi:MAG: TRAP transporter large permease subunit, partial [Dehalococcoidia bacterium]|nr:TRAP transporter large permease subunit [Dehalococcoidia bacterium]
GLGKVERPAEEVIVTESRSESTTAFNRIARWLERIAGSLGWWFNGAGAAILAVMMVLVTVDVCLRYFFNRPLSGTYEIVELMMAVLVFGALAYTAIKKSHISIDAVTSRLSPGNQGAIASIASLIGIALCILIAWQTALWGNKQWLAGQLTTSTNIPIYPFVWFAAFGFALLGLVLIVHFIKSLAQSLENSRWQTRLNLALGLVLTVLVVAYAIWGKSLSLDLSRSMVGIIGVVGLLILLFSNMYVGFAMGIIGFLGYSYLANTGSALGVLGTGPFSFSSSYTMSVIPLFVLMGEFAFHAGLTRELYGTAYRWLGHLPGGLAMATIGGCAGFSAICGSTTATAATVGVVALPEMKRYKYDPSLATACVASGGTLGIMIPPSIGLVVYGIIASQSIGKLFMAGILPGLLLSLLFMIVIYFLCKRNPLLGPPGEKTSFTQKMVSLKGTWTVIVLFFLVMGGIYFGIFTPTEGAAIGAAGAFVITVSKRKFNKQVITRSFLESTKNTAMVMFVLMGAEVFSKFLTVSRITNDIATFVSGLAVPPIAIFTIILLVYLVLGCFLSTLAMVIITVPIFLPVLVTLGYDPIWFGVISILVCEMGLITPPVGMNVFVIQGLVKDVPMYTIFKGIWPFLIAEIVATYILVAFPQIALFLPSKM